MSSPTPTPTPPPEQMPPDNITAQAPDVAPTESPADMIHDFVSGARSLADVAAAVSATSEAMDAVAEVVEPAGAVLAAVELVWGTIEAMEIKERIWGAQGWCYGVMGAARGLPECPPPDWTGCNDDPDPEAQNELNKHAFRSGVGDGRSACGSVAFRNKVLLRIAYDGQDDQKTLNALWQAACGQMSGGSDVLAAQPALSWPAPPELPRG